MTCQSRTDAPGDVHHASFIFDNAKGVRELRIQRGNGDAVAGHRKGDGSFDVARLDAAAVYHEFDSNMGVASGYSPARSPERQILSPVKGDRLFFRIDTTSMAAHPPTPFRINPIDPAPLRHLRYQIDFPFAMCHQTQDHFSCIS